MFRKASSLVTLVAFASGSLHFPLLGASNGHFKAVDAHLEQGGVLYGFVDIDGDVTRIAESATEFLTTLRATTPELAQIPPLPFDVISKKLGFSAIQAIGLSSTVRERGFHNRTFILTEGMPSGLLGLYGVENVAFSVLDIAPAGADVVAEQSLDAERLSGIARELAVLFMGPQGEAMVETYLDMPVAQSSVTFRELLSALQGRGYLILELSETETMVVPEFGEIAKVDFLLRLESAAPLVPKLAEMPGLAEMPNLELTTEGDRVRLSGFLPEDPDYSPILLGDNATGELLFVSSQDYLERCLGDDGPKLGDSEAYAAATEGLPAEGYAMGYFSPDIRPLLDTFIERSIEEAGPEAAMMRPYMEWSFGALMAEYPMASVGTVEPNGLYVASNWNVSHKRNLATMAYANPVTIGLLAAMAIPAFNKVRATSQEKTITNNLRMLASAADQYFLENGETSVKTDELIGPNAYIRSLEPVMGETYPEEITTDMEALSATLPNGETVSIPF
ncbi:MAG: type IV pilin protein [Opitutales bacterium]